MEENVALDSNKQKKFNKSIKKLMQKKNAEPKSAEGEKVKLGRISKKKRKQRGLVYLAHIPHGFYEHEMTQYFKQFGVVTNARVIKSKRTGRSKGYAFVEFKEPTVAQIVAETMNNYLMGKRLIKASYIPPQKQRRASRRHWNSVNNPTNETRIKIKKDHNENRDEIGELKKARKLLSTINNTKQKLKELGINYDFFTPVDVPEQLQNKDQVKEEDKEKSNQELNKITKKGKNKNETANKVKVKLDPKHEKAKPQKQDKDKMANQLKADKNTQKQKKNTLKDKSFQLPEEFIKVQQDSDNDSDSSQEFDSDEFEKMMQSDEDENDSSGLDESDSQQSGASESTRDESEEEIQVNKNKKAVKKNKEVKVIPEIQSMKSRLTIKKEPKTQQHRVKRHPFQEFDVVMSKAPKFSKKINQKARNKQFKKK